ncbi:MAG: phosphatidylserine/phosphatidylglycerophosphate/cardiolipin synthase family protein [Gammaproteobacteria bacterium]|nr:phosphatidylserine/phosphatidylglycerophosphate/cardiolipin synthase family protein [Gammaproteobacteria bacterium]
MVILRTIHFRLTCYRVLICLALVLLSACSNPEVEPPIDESIPADPLFILLDAYKGNEQYFLRYRRGETIYYAAGDLPLELNTGQPAAHGNYDVPVVASMGRRKGESWEELTKNLIPVPVLDVQDWAALRERLFAELVPRTPNHGVAVSFDRVDYFFFYDKSGNFRARRLIDMPPWYSVAGHVDLREHFADWQPVLQQFLQESGIESEDVIFSTGDLDQGSIPFLYINTRSKLIVLVQYDELAETTVGAVPGLHVLQSFWHVFQSHTYTILMRPFTSIQSLLSVVSDTAVETGRGLIPDLRFDGPAPPVADHPVMDRTDWEDYLDKALGRTASSGELEFLVDGEKFFTRFIDVLASAKDSIDIRAYIFDNDDVALNIGELLKRRSREGVNVRVLFDGLGTIAASGEQSDTLPGTYRAPLSIKNYLEKDSKVEVRKSQNPWLTGDHVKTMIIDKKIAFLGGMNIGREYRYDWHDMMVEVRGPVVDRINREFQIAWGRAGIFGDFSYIFNWKTKNRNAGLGGYPVRLIYTKPGNDEIYHLQRDAILRSQRYIYIENAYFTDDALLRALIVARRRGVDVRVIIPLETDRGVITRNIILAANTMLAQGIRVYIYPGFSHAKAAIFDGWASVGSANLDRLSLHINQEINIATSEPVAVQALMDSLFEPDFAKSRELTEPFEERWTDRIVEMFGDYLF